MLPRWLYKERSLHFPASHLMAAISQEEQTLVNNASPLPIPVEEEEAGSGFGCGCFGLFGFRSSGSYGNNENGYVLQNGGERRSSWWAKRVKEAKEFSEVLAGPKWKNFIRKLGGKKKKKNQFQYDAESYALNFDHGCGVDSEEDGLLPSFSSRFPPHFPQQSRP